MHSRWQDTAFSGEGAALYPGRWNKNGERLIYLADSLALAVLETRVHLEAYAVEEPYSAIDVSLPDEVVVKIEGLEETWQYNLAYTRSLGSAWLAGGNSLALQVPSAIVPTETNILLNPVHPAMRRIQQERPMAFQWDSRLF